MSFLVTLYHISQENHILPYEQLEVISTNKPQVGRTEVADSKGVWLEEDGLASSTEILTLTAHTILYFFRIMD